MIRKEGYLLPAVIILSTILLLPVFKVSDKETPEASGGILNLSEMTEEGIYPLRGEWRFRPLESESPEETGYLTVPGNWHHLTDTPYAEGEYTLILELPVPFPSQGALLFPELSQILELKVNGLTVYTSGDWENGITDFTRHLVPVYLSPRTTLTVRLKNREYRTGGLHHPPLFGTYTRLYKYRVIRILAEAVNIGILFFAALYHLFLFARGYTNRSALFLGVAALVVMARGFVAGENTVTFILPRLSWYLDYRLEYLTVYGNIIFLILFAYHTFPLKRRELYLILKGLAHTGMFLAIVSVFLPVRILSRTIGVLQVYITLMIAIGVVIFIHALWEGKKGAALFCTGGLLFVILSLLDSLYYLGMGTYFNTSQLGMLIFMLTQSIVLSRFYGDAYLRAEVLTRSLEAEVAERTAALENTNDSLKNEIRIRLQAEEQLRKLSTTDPLTGAANRLKINADLEQTHGLYLRYGNPYGVVMFDVDHFKQVNDSHGHAVGDEVLKEVVRISLDVIRECDILSRWGGEEFLILLPQVNLTGAAAAAERIRKRLEETDFPAAGRVTASFGAAVPAGRREPLKELLHRLDVNLYQAKNEGRNRVVS